MRMEMSPQHSQRLEQRTVYEMRQELRQETLALNNELTQLLDHAGLFLELDREEDQQVLKDSMTYLVLHELGHPLFDRYTERFSLPGKPLYPQAKEIAVDALGTQAGILICDEAMENLVRSHHAIATRVYRNTFERERTEPNVYFLARISAELDTHTSEHAFVKPTNEAFQTRSADLYGEEFQRTMTTYKECYGRFLDISQDLVKSEIERIKTEKRKTSKRWYF